MTNETKQGKKRNLVTYAYGQIYRGYLESDRAQKFIIKNIHVREWRTILGWLKRNEYIINYKLGDTFETACELEVEGFNENNLIYQRYLKGIVKNMVAELNAA